MRAVPRSEWEAGLALGVRRGRVARSIVIRSALPGLVTGNLLAVARAVGETAPLLFTAIGSQLFTLSPVQPMANIPITIYTDGTSPFPARPADGLGGGVRPPRLRPYPEHRGPDGGRPAEPAGPVRAVNIGWASGVRNDVMMGRVA